MTLLLSCLLITVKAIKFKKSVLIIGKVSGVFFNTLTGGQKYSLLNRDNLMQLTQMELSLEGKGFFAIFF